MQKVVFITGASRGIGQATAQLFSKNDWQVVGSYKNNPGPEIKNGQYVQMDVSSLSSIQNVMQKLSSVDCLINCAGIFGFQNLAGYNEQLMNEVINTNEKGTYWCTQEIMTKITKGNIVNVSSVAGQAGSGSDPIYAATKGAILAFTKSMARALAPNIRVNCVAPGMVDTDMAKDRKWEDVAYVTDQTPLGKMATPEQVAESIFFLANAEQITGACLDINGGYVMR